MKKVIFAAAAIAAMSTYAQASEATPEQAVATYAGISFAQDVCRFTPEPRFMEALRQVGKTGVPTKIANAILETVYDEYGHYWEEAPPERKRDYCRLMRARFGVKKL